MVQEAILTGNRLSTVAVVTMGAKGSAEGPCPRLSAALLCKSLLTSAPSEAVKEAPGGREERVDDST